MEEQTKKQKQHTLLISDSFGNKEEKGTHEKAFRKWLVRELDAGRITVGEAIERFNFHPQKGVWLIKSWCNRYAPDLPVSLPVMTEKERAKLEALHKRIKQLEKQLEDAQMKNIALDTMIDLAEENLKVVIRKKSGPKQ